MRQESPLSIDMIVTLILVGAALLLAPYLTPTSWMIPAVLAFGASPLLPIASASDRYYDQFYLVAATIPFLFPDPAATALVLLLGVAVIRVARMSRLIGQEALSVDVRRLIGAAIFAAALLTANIPDAVGDEFVGSILMTAGALLLWFAFEVFWRSSIEVRDSGVGVGYLLSTSANDAPLFAALTGTGVIFGSIVGHDASHWWIASVVALVPFIMTISSFRRYGSVRRTYSQTILALARIPEVAGLGLDGHAERTAELAVAVAKDMGLPPRRVHDVHYAALMHDIGRITLTEPSIVERGFTEGDIDRWSSEIIAEAEYLQKAASIVSMHNQPFRRPGEEADPDLPIEAKIIRATSAFDRAVFGDNLRPLEALERLHRGSAYDFDPRVVRSLRLVLARMGVTTV